MSTEFPKDKTLTAEFISIIDELNERKHLGYTNWTVRLGGGGYYFYPPVHGKFGNAIFLEEARKLISELKRGDNHG